MRWVVVSGMCVSVSLIWAWIRGEGLLCQFHYSWAWSPPLTHFTFSHALCRTYGLPTLEAATACPARAVALCSAHIRSQSTPRRRPFSCSLQVKCPSPWDSASTTPFAGLYLLSCFFYTGDFSRSFQPLVGFLVLFPAPISIFSLRSFLPFSLGFKYAFHPCAGVILIFSVSFQF